MEKRDIELIETLSNENAELKALYEEHLEFERLLEKINDKSYLTPSEDMDRRQLQKKKLLGRDKIEMILREYRAQQ